MSFLRKTIIIFIALLAAASLASCKAKGIESPDSSSPNDTHHGKSGNHYSVDSGPIIDVDDIDKDEVEPLFVCFSGGAIRWDDVSAVVYTVKIDGEKAANTTDLYFVPSLSAGVYVAEVVAYLSLGSAKTMSGQVEIAVSANKPIIASDGYVISWDGVDGAVGYDIYKDGGFLCRVTDNSYAAAQDGLYSVKVIFADPRLNSPMSESVVVGEIELSAPAIFFDGDFIRWSAVPGAQMYAIYIEGDLAAVCFDNFYELGILYAQQYAESYPEGIEVSVSARAAGAQESPLSNVVTFKK